MEKAEIYLTEIPEHYIRIKTGLGDAPPRNIVLMPMIINDEVLGVIELASLKVMEPFEVDFLKKIAELIGQNHNIVRHPDMPKEVFKLVWQTIGKGQPFRGFVKNKKKDGGVYWVDAVIAPVIGEDAKPEKYIGVRYDITESMMKQETFTYDLGEIGKFTIPKA